MSNPYAIPKEYEIAPNSFTWQDTRGQWWTTIEYSNMTQTRPATIAEILESQKGKER